VLKGCATIGRVFGTLLGPLAWPDPLVPRGGDGTTFDAAVAAVIEAQLEAGLEPVTDGWLRAPDPFDVGSPAAIAEGVVTAWQFAAGCTDAPVKQALPGPYTLGRRFAERHSGGTQDSAGEVAARALRERISELIAVGCPYIEVHEPDATRIGDDGVERARYRQVHATLLDGIEGAHVSLAITGGSADAAGAATILAPGYQSLAVDLIAGPDNWRLVTAAAGTMGIVCGALSSAPGSDDGPELLVWATRYAASTGGRGAARVGLATASGLHGLTWDQAVAKMRRLGEAARLAGLPPGEQLASSLDPRSVDLRSRALGRRRPRGKLRSTEPPPKGV